MGWTVVEPLSPGFFQLDPTAFGAESKTSRVFEGISVVGKAVKQIVEALMEKLSKEVAEEVSEQVAKEVGKKVSAKSTKAAVAEVSEEAYENVQKRQLAKHAAGKSTKKALAGPALEAAWKKEARELASKKLIKEGVGETIEGGAKKGFFKRIFTRGSKEGGQKTAREAAEESMTETIESGGKGLTKTQKQIVGYAGKGATGLLIIGGGLLIVNNFLTPLGESIGGAAADWGSAFSHENCRDDAEEAWPDNPEVWGDKTEECHNKVNARIATAGIAVLGVGALLIFGMFAYLVPKAANEPEETGE
jgi:hypothetical protein